MTNVLSADEKIKLVLDNDLVWNLYVKEQVFLLVADIFNNLSSDCKDMLIDAIEKVGMRSSENKRTYEVYNWCVWIQKVDDKNERVNSLIKEILAENNYKPREYPELDVVVYPAIWGEDRSPVTEKELLCLTPEKVVNFLVNYKEDVFDGPNRYGLLKTFSTCISKKFGWTQNIILQLLKCDVTEGDIWDSLFYGLQDSEFKLDEAIEMLEILTKKNSKLYSGKPVTEYLWKVIRRADCKDNFESYEKRLIAIAEAIWNKHNRKKPEVDGIINVAGNTTAGILMHVWIYMLSYTKNNGIPSAYKEKLEYFLKQRSWERGVSICVLAGYFDFLFSRDKEWCVNWLLPFFVGKSQKTFACAWAGYVHISGRIDKNTADIMAPVFLKAIKRLKWLESDSKHAFVELLLTLMIHAIDNPTLKYIPEYYKVADSEDIRIFIGAIKNRLKNMDEQTKKIWWDQWLKKFLDNRKINKPILLEEEENQVIFELLPYLGQVFEEATGTICRGTVPSKMDTFFWYELQEAHLAQTYPNSVAEIISMILDNGTIGYFEQIIIKQIVGELTGLDIKKQKQLQELLLKNGITI